MKKPPKARKRRHLIDNAVTKIKSSIAAAANKSENPSADAKTGPEAENSTSEPSQTVPEAQSPAPPSKNPASAKPQRRKYQPHASPGTEFLDSRRRHYRTTEAGELRAVSKPVSKVKRQRAEKQKGQK